MWTQHGSQTFHLSLPGYLIIRKLVVSMCALHFFYHQEIKYSDQFVWSLHLQPEFQQNLHCKRTCIIMMIFHKTSQSRTFPQTFKGHTWSAIFRQSLSRFDPASEIFLAALMTSMVLLSGPWPLQWQETVSSPGTPLAVTTLASLFWPPTSLGYDPLVNLSPIPVVTPFPKRLVWPPSPAQCVPFHISHCTSLSQPVVLNPFHNPLITPFH